MNKNIPKYGVFTPSTLMLYDDFEDDNSKNLLKKSSILFDKLIIIPLGLGPLNGSGIMTLERFVESFTRGEAVKDFKNYLSIFQSIDEFGDEAYTKKFYMSEYSQYSLWQGEKSDRYIDFVKEYVKKKYNYKTKEISSREHFDLLKNYIGRISADFSTLSLATQDLNSASGLFSQIHEEAFKFTMDIVEPKIVNNLINQIEQINYFDFGNLSWNEIIELRQSNFVQDFRRFVNEWFTMYKTSDFDKLDFESRLEKFINDSKFSFIEENTPNLKRSILSGILGNLPLPIPLNPVSIVETINSIENQYNMIDKYGWLMFIQKTYKMNKLKIGT